MAFRVEICLSTHEVTFFDIILIIWNTNPSAITANTDKECNTVKIKVFWNVMPCQVINILGSLMPPLSG
jgi:hypothetical protein